MEFAFTCKVCQDREAWTTELACAAAAAWHLWDVHYDEWVHLHGQGWPSEPLPQELGRRFDAWEMQS